MTALPPDLRARLLAEVRARPALPRAAVMRRSFSYIAAGFAWLGIVAGCFGFHIGARPQPFVAALAASWAAVAAGSTAVLVARGGSMLGRSRSVLVAAFVATPTMLLGTLATMYALFPAATALDCAPRIHAICFATSLVLALGPLAAFALVRRGTDPVHPHATSVALAMSAGTWASFASIFHCPFSGAVHVLLGHVLPVLAQLVALRTREPRSRADV
jgi:hypothetical protein